MSSQTILRILRAKNTVFTFKELALLLSITNTEALAAKIHYYVKTGALYHIRKGFYAKDNHYNPLELATKIYTPAYISFETALVQHGVIFQMYQPIFVASYLSREIHCDNRHFIFRKIKNTVLTNDIGLLQQDDFFIADRERAFLDTLYLNKDYYFDHLHQINWEKCFERVGLYKNKSLERRLTYIFHQWKKNV